MRDHRQRPHGARRREQPVHAEEDPARHARSPARTACRSINLVESGGADLPTQSEIFIPGGQVVPRHHRTVGRAASRTIVARVRQLHRRRRVRARACATTSVMIKERSKVFLGGPPLVKMATGEESDDESLGGAEMHARAQRPRRLLRRRRDGRHPPRPPDRRAAQPPQARARPAWRGPTRRGTTRSSCSASRRPTRRSRSTHAR